MPPLVHRLNNLLAVIGGHCDVWASRDPVHRVEAPDRVDQVRAGAVEAGRNLAALSSLSKETTDDELTEAPLEPALTAVRDLALPLANERGVALRAELLGGDGVVPCGPNAFERAVLLAALGAVSELGRQPRSPEDRPLVRLRAAVGPDRIALTLSLAAAGLERVVDQVRADAAQLRALSTGAVRERRRAGVWCLRVVLRGRVRLAAAGAVAASGRARVLLVERDQLLADLMASVLREEEFVVTVAEDMQSATEAASRASILLLDHGLAARFPDETAALTATVPRTLFLGGAVRDSTRREAVLSKPFRPDALIRAITELLG